MIVRKTEEFNEWLHNQKLKDQLQIDSRIQKIEEYNHFGDVKRLGNDIAELRWKNGRRVYFTKITYEVNSFVLLLIGGHKNSQRKDMARARGIYRGLK